MHFPLNLTPEALFIFDSVLDASHCGGYQTEPRPVTAACVKRPDRDPGQNYSHSRFRKRKK